MTDTNDIRAMLARWFDEGDELTHRRAYELLKDCLYAPPGAVTVLGAGAVDEIRQDVLVRLLDRKTRSLGGKRPPLAYARASFRNALASAMRKWGPRADREPEVRRHVEALAPRPESDRVEQRLDAERAVEIANSLTGKGRLAVLLTTRPDRISPGDWSDIVSKLPPPPPPRPQVPLEREEACLLLYPPTDPGDENQQVRSLNSFDQAYRRAIKRIRKELEVER